MKKSIFLCLILILMLLHADYVTEGARYGLLLWYNSVVPALFPFMVLSGLIVASGGVSVIMTPVHALFGRLLPLSPEGFYVLTAGLLCGYPMGAKTCADFIREGKISLREGKFLMAVCNHPSPMFLLGYVYPFFAGDIRLWEMLAAVYGPAAVLGWIAGNVYFPRGKKDTAGALAQALLRSGTDSGGVIGRNELLAENDSSAQDSSRPGADSGNAASASADDLILSAAEILCKIGGYMVYFSILIIFLRHAAWLPKAFRLGLMAAMEMTTGIREAASFLPFPASFAAAMAALSFGGFSGMFQTNSVIAAVAPGRLFPNEKKAGLSIRQYFFWKLLHAALSAGIARLCTGL